MRGVCAGTRRERFLAAVCAGLGMVWFLWGFVGRPLFQERDSLRRRIAVLERRRAKLERAVLRGRGRLLAARGWMDGFRQEGPDAAVTAGMVTSVERAARKCGVRIEEASPGGPRRTSRKGARSLGREATPLREFPLRLRTTASSDGVVCLIDEIERGPTDLRVTRMELRRSRLRTDGLRCVLEVVRLRFGPPGGAGR